MNYDVFISCKSEDYSFAEKIYNYLKDNGINTFLASTELRQMGESEYRRAISQAMKSTYHLIVFASNAKYIDSPWVYYEWDMFLNAKLNGRKQGQILTILKDVDVKDINMDLWKYESLTFDDFRRKILAYVETPASQQRKEEAKRKAQEEADRLRIEAEQKYEFEKKKKNLLIYSEEFQGKLSQLQSIEGSKILYTLKELGKEFRRCPVCGREVSVSASFCKECGWSLSPFDGIDELAYLNKQNTVQIEISKQLYENSKSIKTNNCGNCSEKQLLLERLKESEKSNIEIQESFEKELARVKAENDIIKREYEECLKKIDELECELRNKNGDIDHTPETLIVASSKETSSLDQAIKLYREGKYKSAFKAFKAFAEQENIIAMNYLGCCYENGQGVKENYEEAVKWYRQAAEQGNADAQYNLGVCYYCGSGVQLDYKEAVKWFLKAAEQGEELGQLSLGECYKTGKGVRKSFKQAAIWYRQAAEQGNADAQYEFGILYKEAKGVEKDITLAFDLFKKSADQGHKDAQYELYLCYKRGNGIRKNTPQAIKWLKKSAENDCVRAQYELGECYWLGIGTTPSEEKAFKWYKMAAKQGHVTAQYCVGRSYGKGEGVNKDKNEAKYWYELAASQGHKLAQEQLDKLNSIWGKIF